jgi:sporulation protein YlmC with PRC-barrel domain
MTIGLKKLLHLPVFTGSGTRLGKISDAEIDTDSQTVVKYRVSAGPFSDKNYLIDRSQILEIGADKIIVEDSLILAPAQEKKEKAPPQTAFGAAAQSVIDQE